MGARFVTPAGFEPAHPKITELESVALDHSATMSLNFSTPSGARTHDNCCIRTVLCQLSYGSSNNIPSVGLEPTTLRLKAECSAKLS